MELVAGGPFVDAGGFVLEEAISFLGAIALGSASIFFGVVEAS